MKPLALLLLLTVILSAEEAPLNWPQFRGPGFMGVVADNPDLPEIWSEEKNVAWKTPVAGRGWSCPVVWGDRVFLTTSINSGETEPAKKGLYFGGNREKPQTIHEWNVLCYDLTTGKPLWDYQVHRGVPPGARHLKNSYASETPITDGERVYAYMGNLGLYTFNLDGKLLWARSWDPVKTRYGWGTASSPFLHDGILYLVNDNDDQSWLTALDAKTGDTKWKIDRDEGSNWSTPFVWENSQRKELITTGTGKVRSYDLEGKLLWALTGFSSITVPLPFAKDDLLYIGSGYVGDKKRPFMAVKPGASGDISLEDGETSNEFIAWSHPQIAPYMPTPILYQDRLYVLLDRGMLACYDAKSGDEIYKRKRLGRYGEFNASPIAFNGKIFCLSERGATVVVNAGDEFEIAHVNELDEMIMATPAIVGDRLLIRTTEHLYCIRKEGLPVAAAPAPAADILGEWALTLKMGDNESDYTLRLAKDDAKLTGVLVSPRSGEHPFSSVSMKDDVLTMEITRTYGDNEVPYAYNGKLAEGALSGSVAIKGAGEQFSGTWNAKRKLAKAAQ